MTDQLDRLASNKKRQLLMEQFDRLWILNLQHHIDDYYLMHGDPRAPSPKGILKTRTKLHE